MRVCLCWLVLAAFSLHAATPPKSETVRGKLVVRSGEEPVVETAEHQRIVLDGDTPTRKVLHDPRVNGFEVEARGHFTAPGQFLIDPQHTRPLLVRDGVVTEIVVIGQSFQDVLRRVETHRRDLVESETFGEFFARVQCGHRICPSPRTTHLRQVSSRSPIGPRACSFWVEIPTSPPSPNSPPSMNLVEAFTMTAAASPRLTHASAFEGLLVRIASLWPVP